MRRVVLALALACAMSAAEAATINTDYRIGGDAEARPVQVFDDGEKLFVQIRDPRSAPAPIGANGPIPYRIQGHYLVMPIVKAFHLQLGAARAEVVGAGGSLPGVVSMTAPIEAVEMPVLPRQVAAPGSFVDAPAPSPSVSPFPANVVTGEIAVGTGAVTLPAAPIAPASTQAPLATMPPASSDAAEPPRMGSRLEQVAHGGHSTLLAAAAGRLVVLTGDGTVRGAQETNRLKATCLSAKARSCAVIYRGAAPGTSRVEID